MEPIFIKEFLPSQVLNILHNYCVLKLVNKTKFNVDSTTNTLFREYSDYLMETILDMSTPVIEENVGKKLWPTYSYLRNYDRGSDLPVHQDRGSCEYTVALCLGCNPVDKPYDIFIGEENKNSNYSYVINESDKKMKLDIKYKFSMLPNNALIFNGQGSENLHWREECEHDYFITVFLHYVDQEGELKDLKFDKRSRLGAPQA